MRTFFVIFTIVVLLFSSETFAQNVWSPETQVNLKVLGSPRISPDGKRIVYTVNSAVMAADKSEFVTQIWIASIDGKQNYQLTFGERSSANPKWSPDGTSIAFTSPRKDNRNHIYILRIAGGEAELASGEAKNSIIDFDWSPDGRSIAFTMSDPKTEDEEKGVRGKNDHRWIDENIKYARLYIISAEPNAEGKRPVRLLTKSDRHVSSFNWSPDSKEIIYSHVLSPSADHWPTSDIDIVTIADGANRKLASTEAAEITPRYSPDGKWIVSMVSDVPVRWADNSRLMIFPAAGGTPRKMDMSHDGQPRIIDWSADGSRIFFTEAKGTRTAIFSADVATGRIREEQSANAVVNAIEFDRKTSLFSFVLQTSSRPPEVYVSRMDAQAPSKVTNVNAGYSALPVGRTEAMKWKSTDGREIEGLLTYPVNYKPGSRVPLILNIHGGPTGVFQESYIGGRGSYPLATLSSRGFAILRPNPRGSSGYGTEFRFANMKDWGEGDYHDLMTGVDKVIELGVADPARLGVMGWSYGGYMTSAIITKTKRFKAASAGAAVTNLMSFNGTADIPSFIPDYFEGEFWDDPATYAKHSAMFNIKGAVTPTLIQHGENDIRVPISQGYELYTALTRQGVPTRMIVLPRQPHGIQEPKLQIATMQSNLDWFEKYLK